MDLGNFILGAASSLVASAVVIAFTQWDDLRYLLTSARHYRQLEGTWLQYHLTAEAKHQPPIFWSLHQETLRVTSFGRVHGQSLGRHRYRIRGAIRNNVMRVRLMNQDAVELSASFTYPRLLARDLIVGVWVGHDYDESVCAGPVILSRCPRSAAELADLVRDERLLGAGGREPIPPIRDAPYLKVDGARLGEVTG